MAAETVDTRVVEAKFDSKQFEQGVDRTVKKLDELKKSLNLKDGEKSVAEIGNKISETSEKASNSLEKLEQRFTSFFGMLKQKLISGIADEIVGSIFKVKNAINGLVSSLSTGQIGYGMQRYTDILTSVRTLTASGVVESAAYETIERLGSYADQTSYSLDQLVSTMSKFKTAGADLHTAQRMVEGLSNAAASMGVNAQDAARAYLNLQQAYSKGKMTQADWISFESLPMVGEKFNQAIIDAAVKVGTLKQNAKGTYEVVSKAVKAAGGTGGRVSGAAAKGITAENMGSKLASGWFNKQVMEEVFGNTYYFAEVGIDEVNQYKSKQREIRNRLKAEGLKEEEIEEKSQKELQDYFDKINEEKLSDKKAEIEERKAAAKAKLDAQNANSADYKDAKKEYDKTIKELDKELEDFKANNTLSAVAFDFFQAGQEARSFNDVLNTLKDTISRGWATSFELIFGKLDEAKDFFTALTESQLAEGIYAIGEFRNAVLENWRNTGGRESLLGLLEYMDNIAGSIWKKLGLINDEEKWFNDNFDQQKYNQILKQEGKEQAEAYKEQVRAQASAANPFEQTAKELGQRLSILTRNIQDFFEKVHKWFTEADSTGTSRLQRISNILEGFGTIGRGALYAVGQGLEFIGKVYNTFKTSFDALWKAIDNISQKVFAVFNPDIKTDGFNIFTALTDTFENILKILKPLNEPLTKFIGILEDVVGFFVDMGISTALMNVQFFTDGFALLLEVLGIGSSQQVRGAGVLDGIVRDIKDLGESCKSAMTAVGDFFKSLFDDLRVLVGLKEDQNGEKHGIFANIENWFNTNEFVQKVKARLDKALIDIGDFVKDLPNRIVDLGVNIGDAFKGLFFDKKLSEIRYDGNRKVEIYTWVKKPLTQWITNAADAVWNFVTVEIPKFVKNIPNIVSEFLNGLFYTKNIAQISYANGKRTVTYVRTPLKKWIDNVIVEVKKFIKDIPNQLNKIPSLIEEFFKSIFYYKTSVANGGVTWVKKPFTQWIDENIVKNLKTFITELPTYIGQAIGTVSNFAGQVVSAIFGKEDGSPVTADDVTEGIRKPFLGANVTGIINSIKGVAKRILSGIASAFTGETDWESNKNWLAEGAAKLLENIKTKAEEVWKSVQDFFATLPEKIEGFFKRSADETEKGGTIWTAGQSVIDGIGKWLSTVPNLLLNAWKSAEAATSGLWSTIIGWITGKSAIEGELNEANQNKYNALMNKYLNPEGAYGDYSMSYEGAASLLEPMKKQMLQDQWRENNPIAANIEDFFVHLGDYFKDKILAIPGQIAGITSNAWDVLSAVKDVIFGTVNEEKYKNKDDSNPLYTATVDVFSAVVKFVIDNASTIGDAIKAGWNKAVTIGSIIGEVLFGDDKPVFDPKKYAEYDALGSYGHTMAEAYKHSTKDYGIYNGVASFFENIKNWVLEQARNLPSKIAAGIKTAVDFAKQVGPAILEGLQSVLTWVTGKVNKVTETIDNAHAEGKSIFDVIKEKLSGKNVKGEDITDPTEKSLWTIVQNIGQSLKTFITDTIPKFLSSAFEEIKQDVPKLINKIFGGEANSASEDMSSEIAEDATGYAEKQYENYVRQNAKKNKSLWDQILDMLIPSANAEEMEEVSEEVTQKTDQQQSQDKKTLIDKIKEKLGGFGGIIDLVKGIGDVAGSFLKSDIGKYLLLGVVISSILSSITDILSMTDEMESAKDLAKWESIKFAVLGIIAILGYISYLAAQSDQTQLNNTLSAFNRLADTLQKLMLPLEIIMGLGMAKSFFDWRAAKSEGDEITGIGSTLVSKISDVFLGPLEGLTTTVGAGLGAGFLGQIGELLAGNLKDVFTELGAGLENLSGYLGDTITNLESITGKIRPAIDTVTEVKDLIKTFIDLLYFEATPDQKLEDAETIQNLINSGFLPPEEAAKLSDSEQKYAVEITTALGKTTRAFSRISGSLTLFKNAISGYGDDATQVTQALKDITSMQENMSTFAEFAQKKEFMQFKEALASLGAIMRLYSDSISSDVTGAPKTINVESVIDVLKNLFENDEFKTLIEDFGKNDKIPNMSESTLENAERIIIFAGALSSIAKACSELDGEKDSEGINNLIKLVTGITFTSDTVHTIDEVASQFGQLGNALGSFAVETSELNDTNIKNAEAAIDMLLRLAIGLKDTPVDTFLANLFTGDKSLGKFGEQIEELGGHLKNFFESIENLNSVGQSRSYNRTNLSLALLAVQGIAESVYIISRAPYLNAFKKNAEGGLIDYLGNLKSLATGVMEFITTVNSYTDTETYGTIDYTFIYNSIDAIKRICEAIGLIPNIYQGSSIKVGDRVDVLNKILFGTTGENGDGVHKGIMASLSEFLQKTVLATKNGEYAIEMSGAASIISSYADVVEQIVLLVMKLGKINYEDLSADNINTSGIAGSYLNSKLTDVIIPSLETINKDYDVIKQFLDNAEAFNQVGLDNAVVFFEGLSNLASALYIFSQKDASTGQYNTTAGLTKLMEFNWESLRTVIDDMRASLGEDKEFYNPKITPVLQLGEFEAEAKKMWSMLGINPGEDWASFTPNMTVNMDGIQFPQPIDYTLHLQHIESQVDDLKQETHELGDQMSKIQFVIKSGALTETIGPDMDRWLGQEAAYVVRANVNNGG